MSDAERADGARVLRERHARADTLSIGIARREVEQPTTACAACSPGDQGTCERCRNTRRVPATKAQLRAAYAAVRARAIACGMSAASFDEAVAAAVPARAGTFPGEWLAAAREVAATAERTQEKAAFLARVRKLFDTPRKGYIYTSVPGRRRGRG